MPTTRLRHAYDTPTTRLRHTYSTFTTRLRHAYDTLRPIYTVRFSRMRPPYITLTTRLRHAHDTLTTRLRHAYDTFQATIGVRFQYMFSNPTAVFSCRIRRLHATKSYRVNRPLDHDIRKVLKSYNFSVSCHKRVIKEEAAFNKVAPSKSAFRRFGHLALVWLSCAFSQISAASQEYFTA